MTDAIDNFGEAAASMFEKKSITLRVHEWVAIFRELETHSPGYRHLQDAFNAKEEP